MEVTFLSYQKTSPKSKLSASSKSLSHTSWLQTISSMWHATSPRKLLMTSRLSTRISISLNFNPKLSLSLTGPLKSTKSTLQIFSLLTEASKLNWSWKTLNHHCLKKIKLHWLATQWTCIETMRWRHWSKTIPTNACKLQLKPE